MTPHKIENLEIKKITEDIFLVHQVKPPFYFSCCDGLIILPKKGRNLNTIILDVNIEPYLIKKINNLFSPISDYVCTHGHMDHIAHVHQWESLGASVHAPIPEDTYLLDLENFYEGFRFKNAMNFSVVKKFADLNGYRACSSINPFNPGETLHFENLIIETLPFSGHSKAHVGFLLPEERIIHISCLGFDKHKINEDGFGPWYGFEQCSLDQYLKDIDVCKSIFLKKSDFLTSSHSYIVKKSDVTPFTYMREKIEKNQSIVDQAIITLKESNKFHPDIDKFLELDLFFPKKRMKGFLREIYNYWETGFITKHIERSKNT